MVLYYGLEVIIIYGQVLSYLQHLLFVLRIALDIQDLFNFPCKFEDFIWFYVECNLNFYGNSIGCVIIFAKSFLQHYTNTGPWQYFYCLSVNVTYLPDINVLEAYC